MLLPRCGNTKRTLVASWAPPRSTCLHLVLLEWLRCLSLPCASCWIATTSANALWEVKLWCICSVLCVFFVLRSCFLLLWFSSSVPFHSLQRTLTDSKEIRGLAVTFSDPSHLSSCALLSSASLSQWKSPDLMTVAVMLCHYQWEIQRML